VSDRFNGTASPTPAAPARREGGPRAGEGRVAAELRQRFNPLRGITPERFVRALEEYSAGRVAGLCRIMEAYMERDDAFRSNSRKAFASIGRCGSAVQAAPGRERDPDARGHRAVLERFWGAARVTSAFNRRQTGGLRLLQRQMAEAICYGHSVHEIVWRPSADGGLRAQFIHVPPWMFETTRGEPRFLPSPSALEGEDLEPWGWLVAAGDAVGVASSICAMSKRLCANDWLDFCGRCGIGLHAQTDASEGSPEWERVVRSVAAGLARNIAVVTGRDTDIKPLPLNTATTPWPELVRQCDRAIAALWRGCDLATMSSGPGEQGASVQRGERDALEEDFCDAVTEALHDQVGRRVIEWHFGAGVEPLARMEIRPTTQPDADADIKIDAHLAALGARLSGSEALARYRRRAYDPAAAGDFPLAGPAAAPGPAAALPNEAPAPDPRRGVYAAWAADTAPWRRKARALLGLPAADRPAAARALIAELAADAAAAPALKEAMCGWIATAYAGAANNHEEEPHT
jgi:hypothetical protein